MFVGDDFSSHLAPLRLLDLGLHGLQLVGLGNEYITHAVQITSQHFLLVLHVLPDVSFALLEGIVEDLQHTFTQTLEFTSDGAVHLVVEGIQLVVEVANLALHLLVQVL